MQSVTTLWQALPKRHKWVLGALLCVLALIILLGVRASHNKQGVVQTSLALPPLPQMQVAQPKAATNQQPTTYEGNDLRIAARRPVLTSPGLEFITSAPPAPARAPSPEPVAPAQVAPPPVAHAMTPPAAAAVPPTHQAVVNANPTTQAPSVQKTSAPAHVDAGKFATLPADAWLLQIAAVSNAQDAKTRCHSLALPCTTYAALRQGRQVWVMVAGPYASRADAVAAIARLPASMQHGPFPRQAQDVRRDAGG